MNSGTELVPEEILDKIQETEVLDKIEVISGNVAQLIIIYVIIAVAVLILGAAALMLVWMYLRLTRSSRANTGKDKVKIGKDSQSSSVAVNIQPGPEPPKEVQVPLRKFHSLPRSSTYQHSVLRESTKPDYVFPLKRTHENRNLSSSLMPINSCPVCLKNNEYRHIQPTVGPLKTCGPFYGKERVHNLNPTRNPVKRSNSLCTRNELDGMNIRKNLRPLSTFGSLSRNNTNLHMRLPANKVSLEGINSQTIGCKFPEAESFKPYFLKREF